MLTALFLSSIAVALLLHYFLVERPRMKSRLMEPSLPQPLPLLEALEALPDGPYLQPATFTWARILPEGHILLGLHPMLVSLVGSPYRLEVIPEGWLLAKGKPLVGILRGGRRLQLLSPVSGRIAEVNPNACMERGWSRPRNGEECWVYRIEPDNLLWDLPTWVSGKEASQWVQGRYQDIRRFVLKHGADAGVQEHLPVGILARRQADAWGAFQGRFLAPEGHNHRVGGLPGRARRPGLSRLRPR
jgi:glycine cleavage system H lipoate-binding protein